MNPPTILAHTAHVSEPLESRLFLAATLLRDIIDDPWGGNAALYPDDDGNGAYILNQTPKRPGVYRTDGTPTGTVRIPRVPTDVNPVNVEGTLFYFRKTALWKAGPDPDDAPVKIRNFAGFKFGLTEAGGKAYFYVRREVDTPQGTNITDYLWTSDGTKAGTYRVQTAEGKPLHLPYHTMGEFDDQLFLAARTTSRDSDGLWKTDGTPEGTQFVFRHDELAETGLIWDLVPAGDTLYFPYEGKLWGTDGTSAGTVALAGDPVGIFPAGDRAFFIPRGDGFNHELWTTDGTTTGTRHVTDLQIQYDHTTWKSAFVNDRFFFVKGSGNHDLYVSDGTPSGTRVLLTAGNVTPPEERPIHSLIAADDRLFFSRWTADAGRELWTTTGTAKSTRMVRDLAPGAESGVKWTLGLVNDKVLFYGRPGNTTMDLWTSDGTSDGTRRFMKVAIPTLGTYYDHITPLENGRFVFAADHPMSAAYYDPDAAGYLWTSDATPAGTRLLTSAGGGLINQVVPAGDRAFFTTYYHHSEGGTVSVTDGTSAGTRLLIHFEDRPIGHLGVLDGAAYFVHGGNALWTSDGTPGGTRHLKDIPGDYIQGFAEFNGNLYFSSGGKDGSDLWITDGTAAGTRLLKSDVPTFLMPNFYNDLDETSFVTDDRMFFFTLSTTSAIELWTTDGTADGTLHLQTFPGHSLKTLADAAILGGRLLFGIRDDGRNRAHLWTSDGTPEGTTLLRKISAAGIGPREFTVVGDTLYFVGHTVKKGHELWRSDGTTAGTKHFRDLNPGPGSAWPENLGVVDLLEVDGRLVFNANDGVHGSEIWITDGTRNGTRRVTDVTPDDSDEWSAPDDFAVVGDHLIFTADDGLRGRELWRLPLADLR